MAMGCVSILQAHVRNLAKETAAAKTKLKEATEMAAETSVGAQAADAAARTAAKAQASAQKARLEEAAKLAKSAATSATQAHKMLKDAAAQHAETKAAAEKQVAAEAAADEEETRGTFRGRSAVIKALLLAAVAWAVAEATAAVGASAITALTSGARQVRPVHVRLPFHLFLFPCPSLPHLCSGPWTGEL